MLGRNAIAAVMLVAVLGSALVAGAVVYYGVDSRGPQVVTQTVTFTSADTIIQIITAVPQNPPAMITVFGTVEIEDNYPVSIDFCRMNALAVNASAATQLSGVRCGMFTSTITNQTSRVLENNYTYYFGSYNARLPNNATYLLQVRMLQSHSGPSFEEQAGWLPLNYTVSSRIGSYGIACFDLIQNGTRNYECNSGFN